LYYRYNNTDVLIADSNIKMYVIGTRLLRNKASVSIDFNKVTVVIHKLEKVDKFQFTVQASGSIFGEQPSLCNKTIIIENVQGIIYIF